MNQEPNQRRRQTYTVPKRNWIHRNPRAFILGATTTSLLIFFSKPIYDCFFADPTPPTTTDFRRM